MLRKAEAAVEAAADVLSLISAQPEAQENLQERELVIHEEVQRITEVFEEQQRQLLDLQEREAVFSTKKAKAVYQENPEKGNFHCSAPDKATIFLGPFKVFRQQGVTPTRKEFISLAQLQLEIQQKMCEYFTSMSGIIRDAQLVLEGKGKKISVRMLRPCLSSLPFAVKPEGPL